MSGYWYFSGTDGRRYCYAKEPTFRCPLADTVTTKHQDDQPDTEATHKAAFRSASCRQGAGADPLMLAQILTRAHRSHIAGRLRVDGRLTERCAICGHQMQRLGFACWIEAIPSEDNAQLRIARRLGTNEYQHVPGARWYRTTKKEAREWAHSRSKLSS